ncbi:pilus assembly protein PilM [Microbacterium sp. NPDC077644]|uniref:type IV pilus biogenesis protein PilM n=1 Tax=Microbacterium sp. NPDC077644 TaxID=3155055 RepID=UPI00344E2D93
MAATRVGVEITEESVRAVEMTIGRSPRVLAYGEAPLPPDAAKDSEIHDEGAVAVAIRQLWSTACIKSRNVTLGIASRRVLVREYTTAALPRPVMQKALPFQVQDLLPVPVNQAVLDFYPTAQEGDQVHGLLVAAVAETVEQMIAAFTRSRIRVTRVDLTAFGLARAVRRDASVGTVAAIHVGDHTTQVVILRDGIPMFVRILPADIETTAVRRRGVLAPVDETADAEIPMLAAVGAAGILPAGIARQADALAPGALRGTLRGEFGGRAVTDLLSRLHSTLDFYMTRPGGTGIDRVLLTGAGAAVNGVQRGLADRDAYPVQVISLADVGAVAGGEPGGELALNLVSTAGLALGKDT